VFQDKFRRLFDLSENQSVTEAEMSSLGWGVREDGWKWHCNALSCYLFILVDFCVFYALQNYLC